MDSPSRCRLVLLFSVIGVVLCGGMARADFCVMCDENFWCVGAAQGAQMCRADESLCFIIGPCPVVPPSPPPEPSDPPPLGDLAIGFEFYLEFQALASTENFPAQIPLSRGADSFAIRQEVAQLAEVELTDVVLKGGSFTVSSIPVNPGKSAAAAESTASMFRIDRTEGSWLRARACSGEIGGVAQLKADMELPAEGAVLLVATTVKNKQVVIAYKISVIPQAQFDADPISPQYAFRQDLKDNFGPDPYATSVGKMRGLCE